MEKLIYVLKAPENGKHSDRKAFVSHLLGLGNRMAELTPLGLRLNVQDDGVNWGEATEHHPALGRSSIHGPFEAVLQLWLEQANAQARSPFEALIAEATPVFHGYKVHERLLVHNLRQSAKPGKRNDGYSQMAMLYIPDTMSRDDWQKAWQDRHTWVALSIHPHLEYIQNVVIEAVTADAPPIEGFGEECFPMVGLHDERPLFKGGEDDETFKHLYEVMYEDAARFIDFDQLDMMISSQFDLIPPVR